MGKLHNLVKQLAQKIAPPASSVESPTFHLFPLLPTELRLQIWQKAQEPRLLVLKNVRTVFFEDWNRKVGVNDKQTIPPLLHVNQESREETLRTYSVVDVGSGPRFYFNEWLDTIVLDKYSFFWLALVNSIDQAIRKSRHGARLRSLAVCGNVSAWWTPHIKNSGRPPPCCVKQLFVVGDLGGFSDSMVQLSPRMEIAREDFWHFNHLIRPNIEEGLVELKDCFVRGELPSVMVVQREFWDLNGPKITGIYM